MSGRIKWDEDGFRTYETGTKKGVVYPWNKSLNNGKGGYGEGYGWNGLTSVSVSPSGADATDLWADDIKYLSLRSREEIGATIEAYGCPEAFEQCDGMASPAPGMIIGQQTRTRFAFSFVSTEGNDTDGDDHGYIIHILYNCTASPSDKQYQTINDSPEAITFSWELTTLPVDVPGYKPMSYVKIKSSAFTTTEELARLHTLEDILYGLDAVTADPEHNIEAADAIPPRVPMPEEIISILTPSNSNG